MRTGHHFPFTTLLDQCELDKYRFQANFEPKDLSAFFIRQMMKIDQIIVTNLVTRHILYLHIEQNAFIFDS